MTAIYSAAPAVTHSASATAMRQRYSALRQGFALQRSLCSPYCLSAPRRCPWRSSRSTVPTVQALSRMFLQKTKPPPTPPRDDSRFVLPYTALTGAFAASLLAQALLQYPICETLVDYTSTIPPGVVAPWGVNSAFLILLTGTAYSLKQAAEDNRLNSRTYQRLNLALLLWSFSPLTNCLFQLDAFTALYLPAFYATLGLPTLAIAGAALRASVGPEEDLPQSSVEDFKEGFDLLGKRTTLGQYFSFNYILNFLVGGSFAFSPRTPIPLPAPLMEETLGIHLERTDFGVQQLAVLTIISYILVDGAERGRLGASTFRNLNICAGLAVATISLSTAQGFSINDSVTAGDAFLPNILSAIALSAVLSGVYFYQGVKRGEE